MKRTTIQNPSIIEMVPIDEDTSALVEKRIKLLERPMCTTALTHVKLMLKKNFLVMTRNLKMFLLQILSPIAICILLFFFQIIADSLSKVTVIENAIDTYDKVPKCLRDEFNPSSSKCITIAYGVIGKKEEWINHSLDYLAISNDLDRNEDIVEIEIDQQPSQFSQYIKSHPNTTQVGIIFCTSNYTVTKDISFPCSNFEHVRGIGDDPLMKDKQLLVYTLFYNWTLFYRTPYISGTVGQNENKDWFLASLKLGIDNSIIDYFSKSESEKRIPLTKNNINPKMEITAQDYPVSPNRFTSGMDVVTSQGAFYSFVPIMINFISTINEILREKSKKLRLGITVMGMSNFSYWASWFLSSLTLNVLTTVVQIMTCRFFDFDIFVKTPFVILLVFFVSFGMSISVIGYLITTICSDTKNGYSFAYGFLLMAIVMQFFLTSGVFIYYLHRMDAELFVYVIRMIFSSYPAFHYSKIYGDIAFKSGKHYSVADSRWVKGVGYTYSDLFEPIKGKFAFPKESFYECPSTLQSIISLNLITFCVGLLALYADIVFPHNRGTQEQPLFFLSYEYWMRCFGCKSNSQSMPRRSSIENRKSQKEYNYSDMKLYDTVSREKERVKFNEKIGTVTKGIRIMGLSKTFNKYPFGITSPNDKIAVQDIWLEVTNGELIALLGHNGAGKSTLINMLTGLLSSNSGNASMLGLDIHTQMKQIQSVIGVCPQFDILWDELTAREHLEMYCNLKGVSPQRIQSEITCRLNEVGLGHVKDASIQTFSGGMKRRVSLAISAIGNPRIIFMDEPTTGMDPKTRNEVWEMIKNLKNNRAIVLTTHAMEEAESLADRIAIVAGGQLKCIGTSLYLKNHYSDGYRLSIVTEPQYIDYARIELKKLIPSCKIQDISGGSILACIPVLNLNELKNFFLIMEADEEENVDQLLDTNQSIQFKKFVKDWGLSHATLEEVFLKITQSKQFLI